MSRIIVTKGAAEGLKRCHLFLKRKDKAAAKRAGEAIGRHLANLETYPEIGRPFEDLPELREYIISFGESGYVALYRYEPALDTIYLLAFRHQREAGY